MALSKTTQDHDEIRSWAEARGGKPAEVASTSKAGTGILRIEFPGATNSNDSNLEEIPWEQFFEKFDASGLSLVYQDVTVEGAQSNFNRLVYPENLSTSAKKGLRKAPAKKTATKSASPAKKSTAKTTGRKTAEAKPTARKGAAANSAAKAPAKKIAAKKTTPAEAAGTKATAKKTAAKAPAARKADVKKAAPSVAARKGATTKKTAAKKTTRAGAQRATVAIKKKAGPAKKSGRR